MNDSASKTPNVSILAGSCVLISPTLSLAPSRNASSIILAHERDRRCHGQNLAESPSACPVVEIDLHRVLGVVDVHNRKPERNYHALKARRRRCHPKIRPHPLQPARSYLLSFGWPGPPTRVDDGLDRSGVFIPYKNIRPSPVLPLPSPPVPTESLAPPSHKISLRRPRKI